MDIELNKIDGKMFGLEAEIMRVTADGHFSGAPHPFDGDAHIERDFCENQLELITPPCASIEDMLDCLKKLQKRAADGIGSEVLWRCSCPPHFDSEDEIKIAEYGGSLKSKTDYRTALCRKYGKRLMLYSGIHFNFSFDSAQLAAFGVRDVRDKNTLYIRLSKYCMRYSWLLVLLTAASPVFDPSFGDGINGFDGFASRRQGSKGYYNKFVPVLDYTNLGTYVQSIQSYADSGALILPAELYTPVRLKPKGDYNLPLLLKNGINHIELRMFDLNPLYPLLVNPLDLYFAYCFILYFAAQPDFDFTDDMQLQAAQNHKNAALYDLSGVSIDGKNIMLAACGVIEHIKEYFSGDEKAAEVMNYQLDKVKNDKRYCHKIKNDFGGDFQNKMLNFSKSMKV